MKKYLTTFPIVTGKKKRLITTYRSNQDGEFLRNKHTDNLSILERCYQIDTEYSFAYLKQQSIKQLVNKHLANKHFYQFDISNFFGSIDQDLLLSKLDKTDENFNRQLIIECSNNKPVGLALGLIPSPYLSNIYLAAFDQALVSELQKIDNSCVYTRYSDDLTISSSSKLELGRIEELIGNLLKTVNLTVNCSKTRETNLEKAGQHLKILGLNIICGERSNYITVGRKFKNNTHYEQNLIRKHAMGSYIKYNEK